MILGIMDIIHGGLTLPGMVLVGDLVLDGEVFMPAGIVHGMVHPGDGAVIMVDTMVAIGAIIITIQGIIMEHPAGIMLTDVLLIREVMPEQVLLDVLV